MNTVPKVLLSDAVLLILRRYARYRSPSLAGTTQLTSHDRKMMTVESLVPMMNSVPRSRAFQRQPRSGKPR